MADFSSMEYGYDSAGLEAYLDAIKSQALTNAKTAVEDISTIETACNDNWEGKAKENFITNLKQDALHVSQQFDTLYSILESEVSSVLAAMANKDESLISVD